MDNGNDLTVTPDPSENVAEITVEVPAPEPVEVTPEVVVVENEGGDAVDAALVEAAIDDAAATAALEARVAELERRILAAEVSAAVAEDVAENAVEVALEAAEDAVEAEVEAEEAAELAEDVADEIEPETSRTHWWFESLADRRARKGK